MAAEWASQQGDHEEASRRAMLCVMAAREISDVDRLYANMLTAGNVFARARMPDEAKEMYLALLDLPWQGGVAETAMAHLGLGSIYAQEGSAQKGFYHTERGLRYVRSHASAEQYKQLLTGIVQLYTSAEDLAGMAHCASELGLGDAETLLIEGIEPEWHVNVVLSLATRLHSLGEHEMARAVVETWKTARPTHAEQGGGRRERIAGADDRPRSGSGD
jgi:hypothetical protein